MGEIVHHAIIVIGHHHDKMVELREKCDQIFDKIFDPTHCMVTPVIQTPVNSYYTFYISPDGSKEGWAPSDACDDARSEIKTLIDKTEYVKYAELIVEADNIEPCVINYKNLP